MAPGRRFSMIAAAASLTLLAQTEFADETYQHAQCDKSDTARPELVEARSFLAN